jgi:hypothetical protein
MPKSISAELYQRYVKESEQIEQAERTDAKSQSVVFTVAMLAGAFGIAIGTLLPGNRGGLGFLIGFFAAFFVGAAVVILPYVRPAKKSDWPKLKESLQSNLLEGSDPEYLPCPHCHTLLQLRRGKRRTEAVEAPPYGSY